MATRRAVIQLAHRQATRAVSPLHWRLAVIANPPNNDGELRGEHLPLPYSVSHGTPPDAFGDPQEEPLDWRRYLSTVLRYRWWILGLVAVGSLGGVAAGRFFPPCYQAQATIWIQSSEPRGAMSRGPIGANQLFDSFAWVDLLKSYVVLDAVARDLRLYLAPERGAAGAFAGFTVSDTYRPGRYRIVVDRTGRTFHLLGAGGEEVQQGAIGDSVGKALGMRWAPTATELPEGSNFDFIVKPLRDAAKGLGNALAVTMDPSGNFLRIGLTGADPTRAAQTVNAVAQRFVEVSADLKRAKSHTLGTLLDEQLRAARDNLQRAESALEQFRVRTATLSPDMGAAAAPSGNASLSTLLGPRLEQEQLRRDRSAIDRALVQMSDSGRSPDGLAFIGAVQRSPDVSQALRDLSTKRAEGRALDSRYTADHPAVQRLTREIEVLERNTIPALARSLRDELAERERVLAPQIAAGDQELRGIPQRVIEEARRRRDVDLATTLYTGVQQRYDEARLAEASSVADVRILDEAVAPQEALKDKASRYIILGFAAGLGLGLFGAVLADRFDPRMRYPDQVTRQMGLNILGALPHVTNRKADVGDDEVLQVVETMRSVRLGLMHAHGTAGPMVLTITSPGMGDGKSFVASNLALACAQAGQRTLLIDGDTRRGALHHVLGVSRQPGLTDFLAGRAPLEAVTQRASYPGLDFIGGGRRTRESPELLGSAAMVDLLVRLRAAYQVIVVDTPPLGAGVDSYTLGTLTGNLVLVLRTGTTNLELARSKVALLAQFPIRVVGVVLNDVRPGDGYGYLYSYLPGYGATDEGGAAITRRRMQSGVRERV